jgi:Phytanoyl-CoA dioxygenase (PhyH)
VTEPLFQDATLETAFSRDGFVVIPLLGEAELSRLRQFYSDHRRGETATRPTHYTIDHPDRGYVSDVMEGLAEILGGAMRRFVPDLQVITASFVVKESHKQSATPLHQDWTFVDESRFRSATVWVPLVDVNLDNGALGIIHGSHRFFGTRPRSSPAPQCESMIDRHGFALFPWMDLQPLRAGEAMVFDNALIHGAPPNLTGEPRVVAGMSVTRAGAALQHSYLLPGEPAEIETYAVDRQFFARYGNDALSALFKAGGRPEGFASLGRRPRSFEPIAREALLDLVQRDPRNRYHEDLVERIRPLAERYGIKLEAPSGRLGPPPPAPSAGAAPAPTSGAGLSSRWSRLSSWFRG